MDNLSNRSFKCMKIVLLVIYGVSIVYSIVVLVNSIVNLVGWENQEQNEKGK